MTLLQAPAPRRCLAALAALTRAPRAALLLDGPGWGAPTLAIRPRPVFSGRLDRLDRLDDDPLAALERRVAERRAAGGPAETGVAALLGYDLLDPEPRPERDGDGLPDAVLLEVDAALRFDGTGADLRQRSPDRELEQLAREAQALAREDAEHAAPPAAGSVADVRTSLPRAAYEAAVGEIRERIRVGDFYQANLCQQFAGRFDGDALALYRRLRRTTASPYAATMSWPGGSLVSLSPEMFLDVRPDGRIETRPIKGTRPRGADPSEDAARAAELTGSAKDRAELTMIVDLERNDLGRICRSGSVRVDELGALESFPEVHHLVARVRGRLEPGIGPRDLVEATFPGGSISGAPKRAVLSALRELEPARRNFFTGALMFWGDDGSLRSSILIRSVVSAGERFWLGAGGGVVWDSEPEAEWRESNHKARALAGALGFEPEQVA